MILCDLNIELKKSAETQTCTGDARIFSPALYYLSYLGMDLRRKQEPYSTLKARIVNSYFKLPLNTGQRLEGMWELYAIRSPTQNQHCGSTSG